MPKKENKYEVFEKHFYKGFQITFCFYIKNPQTKILTVFLRNKKWRRIDFIMMTDETLENLKNKVRIFLKKPDLRDGNVRRLGINIFRTEEQRQQSKEEKILVQREVLSRLEDIWGPDDPIPPENPYDEARRHNRELDYQSGYVDEHRYE